MAKSYFKKKKMSSDQLLFEIKNQVSKEPERAFVISADKKVGYEHVVDVLALLKKSGAKAGLLLNPAN